MTKIHLYKRVALGFGVLLALSVVAAVPRPPQFVEIAFDNCAELMTWQDVSDFLSEMNALNNHRMRFTFMVSAAGLVRSDRPGTRNFYKVPEGTGRSNIDWGGSGEDVAARIQYINKLYLAGNEIASHTVGHFSGRHWGTGRWQQEFDLFHYVIDNVASLNGFANSPEYKFAFSSKDINGFRAPYLDGNSSLNEILAQNKYTYDTSDPDHGMSPDSWPTRIRVRSSDTGPWNFGLGYVPIAGSKRRTHSMDYNFWATQEGEQTRLGRAEADGEAMYQSYMNYFTKNYSGNRAPLHIGHHFFPYQGGAYNVALKRFARSVCGLPEVHCATYKDLVDFMDAQSPEDLADLQAGDFPKMPTGVHFR